MIDINECKKQEHIFMFTKYMLSNLLNNDNAG